MADLPAAYWAELASRRPVVVAAKLPETYEIEECEMRYEEALATAFMVREG